MTPLCGKTIPVVLFDARFRHEEVGEAPSHSPSQGRGTAGAQLCRWCPQCCWCLLVPAVRAHPEPGQTRGTGAGRRVPHVGELTAGPPVMLWSSVQFGFRCFSLKIHGKLPITNVGFFGVSRRSASLRREPPEGAGCRLLGRAPPA